MAIAFTKGTLNPASTSLARDIRNAWVSAFTGQPNWTVLDNGYVNGTIERTVITNSNGFSIMLANSTTLTDTRLFVYIGRTYDTINHILKRIAFTGTSKVIPKKITIHDQHYTATDTTPERTSSTTYFIGFGLAGSSWVPEVGISRTYSITGMYMHKTTTWSNGAPNQYALLKVPDWLVTTEDYHPVNIDGATDMVDKGTYIDIINDYYWWQCFNPYTIKDVVLSQEEIASTEDNYITATASQTEWSAHINNDYATLSVKTGGANNGQWVHFGKATSIIDNATITDTYPYFLSFSINTVAPYGSQVAVLDALKPIDDTYNIKVDAATYPGKTTIPPAAITYFDKYNANYTAGSLTDIYIARDNPVTGVNNNTNGALRAKLQGIKTANPTNAIWGDYAVVGAKTYMYVGGNVSTAGVSSYSLSGWAEIN